MTPATKTSPTEMSILALVKARETAAANRQAALAAAGVANQAFVNYTKALAAHLGSSVEDLARRFEVPTILCLSQAGFGELLERKLQGTPPNMVEICEHQHFQLREKIALAQARENVRQGVL
jgi:hypothetical protein